MNQPIRQYMPVDRGDNFVCPFSQEGFKLLRPFSSVDTTLIPITQVSVALPLMESDDICCMNTFYKDHPVLEADFFDWQDANDPLQLLEHLPERYFFCDDIMADIAECLLIHKDTVIVVRDYVATYRLICH